MEATEAMDLASAEEALQAGALQLVVESFSRTEYREVLEAERTDFVGRERYERRRAGARGLRNGYEPKTLRTSGGKVPVEVPQVRDAEEPFRSDVLGLLGSRTEELERLAKAYGPFNAALSARFIGI